MTLKVLQLRYAPTNIGELLCRNMGPDNFEEAFMGLLGKKYHMSNYITGETARLEYQMIKMIAARERVYKKKLCEFDPCS